MCYNRHAQLLATIAFVLYSVCKTNNSRKVLIMNNLDTYSDTTPINYSIPKERLLQEWCWS